MSNNRKMKIRLLSLTLGLAIIAVIVAVIYGYGKERGGNGRGVKVGLIMTGSRNDSGWNARHYEGASAACSNFGTTLMLEENVEEGTGECVKAAERLVNGGAELVMLASYGYSEELLSFIKAHPGVSFYSISPDYHTDNLSTYFCRMYQARFLSGIIAGLQTKTDKIGYVAAMPNSEVNRGISAFTLGARSVNPNASVIVCWTNSWDDEDTETRLTNSLIRERNVDVMSCHQNQPYVVIAADKAGVDCIGYNEETKGLSDHFLTAVVSDWTYVYKTLIRRFLQGNANKYPSIWIGIEEDAVRLTEYSDRVPDTSRQIVRNAQDRLLDGHEVFSGEIYDCEGVKRCSEGEAISDESLLAGFDWYADGVEFYEE